MIPLYSEAHESWLRHHYGMNNKPWGKVLCGCGHVASFQCGLCGKELCVGCADLAACPDGVIHELSEVSA
jgi:hypothetical protein